MIIRDQNGSWSVIAVSGCFVLASLGVALAGLAAPARWSGPGDLPDLAVVFAPSVALDGLDENFRLQVEACFLPASALYGYDLRVTSGFRSWQEQDDLYRQGRYEHGHLVTKVPGGFSSHNYGLAVDVADRRRGYRIDWEKLGRIGAYCGFEQGEEGDEPHFQHRAGLSINDLMSGRRPPSLVLPCVVMAERQLNGGSLSAADMRTCPPIVFSLAEQEL